MGRDQDAVKGSHRKGEDLDDLDASTEREGSRILHDQTEEDGEKLCDADLRVALWMNDRDTAAVDRRDVLDEFVCADLPRLRPLQLGERLEHGLSETGQRDDGLCLSHHRLDDRLAGLCPDLSFHRQRRGFGGQRDGRWRGRRRRIIGEERGKGLWRCSLGCVSKGLGGETEGLELLVDRVEREGRSGAHPAFSLSGSEERIER